MSHLRVLPEPTSSALTPKLVAGDNQALDHIRFRPPGAAVMRAGVGSARAARRLFLLADARDVGGSLLRLHLGCLLGQDGLLALRRLPGLLAAHTQLGARPIRCPVSRELR